MEISENISKIVYAIFMLIILAIANFWPDPKTQNFAIAAIAIISMTLIAVVKIKKDKKDS